MEYSRNLKALPEKLLQSLEGVPGYEREAFIKVHEAGILQTSIRLNPAKTQGVHLSFETTESVPWCQTGFYLAQRPSFTFDPLFHAGLYYVQEASSMFLETAFRQLLNTDLPLKVLDLCAAPGGKSTHVQTIISSDSLLVSNEVIKSRCRTLVDNIIKWGCQNVIVTNNDPSAFSKLKGYFDVMVVDAPCSGSGLFRRDEEAIDEWSLNNVQLCCQRQQRILADALPALKENGLLIYSTCSYSKEEDEDIMDWLVQEMAMENEVLETDPSWNIIETNAPLTASKGYRFFPHKLKGEGLFLSCFRKKNDADEIKLRPGKSEQASTKEKGIIMPWLRENSIEIIREREHFNGISDSIFNQYLELKSVLNIQYAGVELGQVMKEKLVPAHALALSQLLSESVLFNELDYDTAIRYLQKQDLSLEAGGIGWQLVRYKGKNLGWINVLANRINNYYPKELRILKRQNDSTF